MAEAQRDEIAKLEALYAANPEGHVFTHLAEAYRRAGELEHAREILAEGLRRHPDSASGHVVLGRVEHDRADHEAARRAFARVLSLDAGNLVALRCLGELALEQGDRAAALGHYRELLARDPGEPAIQQLVADLARMSEPVPGAPEPQAEPEPLPLVEAADTEPEAVLAGTEEPGRPAAEPEELVSAEWVSDEPDLQPPEELVSAEWVSDEPELQPAETRDTGEPEFLGLRFDEEEAVDAELPEFALDGAELEFLDVDDEAAEAPGEFLVLDAPEQLTEVEPELSKPWVEPEGEPPAEVAAPEPELLAQPETESLPEVEPESAAEVGAGSAEPWAVVDAVAEGDAEPAEPELQSAAEAEAAVAFDEPSEPAPPESEPLAAGEAELVLSAAFEAPAEEILPLPELLPLGDAVGESESAPGPAAEPAAAGLFTETMAELYRTQGFPDRAAEVYRWLLGQDPENERLQQLLAETVAAAAAPAAPPSPAPARREWLQDVLAVESAFTGAAGAAAGADTPYAWSGAGEESQVAGPAISAYFRELLAWRPAVQPVTAEAAPSPEPEPVTEATLVPPAGELLLEEEVVELAPWEESPASPPEPEPETAAARATQDLMPWEFAEPPALAAEALPEQPMPLPKLPQDEPAAAEEARPGEVEAEDEDLEMFRSWLQSLKK